ncbi:HEAT repeat associated with sister chromatid cohesion [Fragilaria crotonensis]|nr:HEAT repeat associated with sister chromatid cohesion [Fragilaria crotonensis]
MALEETRAFVSRRAIRAKVPDAVPPIIETHVFRQLVLTHLSDNPDSSPGFKFAREFLLAMWVKDLCAENGRLWNQSRCLGSTIPRPVGPASCQHPCVQEHGDNIFTEQGWIPSTHDNLAATKSDLVASFPRQIGLLIQFMADEAFVSIRKLAVKALSQVVDADSKLMLHPALKNAVSARFADEAKSVREAVVGLVGSFVVCRPELANAFHSSFLARLLDEGVSVKKRTVKIFRDILMTNPNYTGRAAACALMLQRAADPKEDDSVRDLIHELFIELWLENSEVPSPVKRMALLVESKEEPAIQSQSTHVGGRSIMVDVVLAAESKDMLTTLLKDLLSGFSDADRDRKSSDRKKRKRSSSSHCARLVDALVDRLLTLEENRGNDVERFGQKLVATIRTIGAIAQVAPQEVRRHVDTLLPYLKADNGISTCQECNVVTEVCDIVYRGCRVMSKGEMHQLAKDSLSDDLVRVTYRLGSSALASAVRTLCELGSHPKLAVDNPFREKAMHLATTFYGYLHKNMNLIEDFSKADKKTKCNVQRALSILGCLCKSHAVENDDTSWMDETPEKTLTMPEDVTWQTMVEACYKIFVTYLATSDVETKCSSMNALGIFISRPGSFLPCNRQERLKPLWLLTLNLNSS